MQIRVKRDREEIGLYCRWMGIYFLCLVLGGMNIGAFGSLLRAIALIPVGIWVLQRHTVQVDRIVSGALFYVLWISFSVIWSVDFDSSIERVISQWSFLVVLMSVSGYRFSDNEIAFLKKCLVWSSRITAVIVLTTSQYLSGRIYLGGAIREDPNYLCAYFLFALIYDLSVILAENKRKGQMILSIVELVVYTYLILGTGSRGGLFASVAACAIVILFYENAKEKKTKTMVGKAVIVVVMALAAYFAMIFVNSNVLNRFSIEAIRSSEGTGRYELWEDALNLFADSPVFRRLFGYGTASAYRLTFLFPFRRHNVMHNMFVENLVEIGMIGLVLYIFHISRFLAAAIKRNDNYSFAVLIGMIVLSLSTSIYTFKPYWNIMLFILCTQSTEKQDNSLKPEIGRTGAR